MVLSGIYQIKIVNLTIVAVFVHFVSLTLAQSSTAKTIENNEFLKVRICISLYKQQKFFFWRVNGNVKVHLFKFVENIHYLLEHLID